MREIPSNDGHFGRLWHAEKGACVGFEDVTGGPRKGIHMRRMRRSVIRGIAVALAMLAGACTDGGGSDSGPTPSASASLRTKPADALPEVWATPASAEIDWHSGLRVDSGLVMTKYGTDSVIAYAADSGKEAWRLRLPDGGHPCTPPSPANEAGLAAVVFGAAACNRAGVVDIRSGTLLWHTDSRETPERDIRASIGPTVLTVQLKCGDLRRFDARTGDVLPTFLTPDRACAHSAGHNGRHVAVINDPDDGTPTAEFALYDAETGAKLWERPMKRRGLRIYAVVSSEPLVVDMEVDSVRMLRVFDSHGNEVRTLGDKLRWSMPPPFDEQLVDGVWVRDLRRMPVPSSGLAAYDLAASRDLLGVPPGAAQEDEVVIGISKGRLVTVRVVKDPTADRFPEAAMWVITHDLRTGERKDVGQVDNSSFEGGSVLKVAYVHGDLLFVTASVRSEHHFVALRLPG
ncbi:PQQ-like beta-propeller repeat protein [Yinghuangia sp. ASG 101]|uniref:outer membrane protein assembly factor BamB family protein n=1 Tax=Yinghuangia sp. ASG 101 TaxID=2896848 RepID=UPI001E3E771C|nr:PQQ-binding-like beta-propeller repeat protein [Yinghuangia sp. ASG 101]UGQ14528.1 PQQ-like beta-propeller repeat protein [Yinghuangia sp. ASG 101]